MIKFENRFDEYAYRVAYRELDSSVTSIEEGKWVTINAAGNLILSTGATKSFLLIGSKRTGRDQLGGKPIQKLSYLYGHFEVSTDKFDGTKTFANMTPLVVDTNGDLRPYVQASDSAIVHLIVAYSLGAPSNGFLRIIAA
jgi:hypothetical protein